MPSPTCATCSHWRGSPAHYAAPCAIGAYPGRVAFDQTCPQHSAPPPIAMQSQVRGVLAPMSGVAVGKAK